MAFQEAKEENPGEDEALRKMLHERLGGGYVHVGSSTVRKIQLHVFAAAGVRPTDVASSSLNTARGGTSKTGSKGAATLSLSVGGAATGTTLAMSGAITGGGALGVDWSLHGPFKVVVQNSSSLGAFVNDSPLHLVLKIFLHRASGIVDLSMILT